MLIKILDSLLYNLDVNVNLLSLIPSIEDRIDKIIAMYSPLDEEQARAVLPIEDQDDPKAIKDVLEGRYF